MATRSIVTSHPDVECDFCRRRLLRGEHPDVFLTGGHRRTVCELCAPRAADVGWMREDHGTPKLVERPARPLRGRGLLWRLRQRHAAGPDGPLDDLQTAERAPRAALPPYPLGAAEVQQGQPGDRGPLGLDDPAREASYDFLGPLHPLEQDARARSRGPSSEGPDGQHPVEGHEPSARPAAGPPEQAPPAVDEGKPPIAPAATDGLDEYDLRALAAFNADHHPRRIAGIARSLGPPLVSVRRTGPAGVLVRITVAWEICWYRYEVDPSDPAAPVRLAAEGMELEELSPEDRLANAAADGRGELTLL